MYTVKFTVNKMCLGISHERQKEARLEVGPGSEGPGQIAGRRGHCGCSKVVS